MAYIRSLGSCQADGCSKLATVEVMSNRNDSIGKFCKACGHRALIRQMKIEDPTLKPKR